MTKITLKYRRRTAELDPLHIFFQNYRHTSRLNVQIASFEAGVCRNTVCLPGFINLDGARLLK